MYEGYTKLVLRHLDFLVEKKGFQFAFNSFRNYKGFFGPSDVYSFYNSKGCFSLHHLVQKGEWGIYVSSKYDADQFALLGKEIPQNQYLSQTTFTSSGFIKQVKKSIEQQMLQTNAVFGITLDRLV